MEIDAAVQQLVEKVLLREEDSEAIRASVCPRVEQLVNSTMLPLDGKLQLSGSFLRGTALSPLHDVDFLLPLVDGFRMYNGTKRKPQDVINDISDLLKNAAGGGAVVQVDLPEAQRQTRSVGVKFGNIHVDLVPVFRSTQGDYEFELPDTYKNEWVGTSPTKHNELFNGLDEETNGNLLRAVVLLKAWKRAVFSDTPLSLGVKLSSFVLEEATCKVPPEQLSGDLPWPRRLQSVFTTLGVHVLGKADMPPNARKAVAAACENTVQKLKSIRDAPSLYRALNILPTLLVSKQVVLASLIGPQPTSLVGGVAIVFLQEGTTFPQSLDFWGPAVAGLREEWTGLTVTPYEVSQPHRGLWTSAYSSGIFVLRVRHSTGVEDTVVFIDCAAVDSTVDLEALVAFSERGALVTILSSQTDGLEQGTVRYATSCDLGTFGPDPEFNLFAPGRPKNEMLKYPHHTLPVRVQAAECTSGLLLTSNLTEVESYLRNVLKKGSSANWLHASMALPSTPDFPSFVAKFTLPCAIMTMKKQTQEVTTIDLHCDLPPRSIFKLFLRCEEPGGVRVCLPLLSGSTIIRVLVPTASVVLAVIAGLPGTAMDPPLSVMGCPVTSLCVQPTSTVPVWESEVVMALFSAPGSADILLEPLSLCDGGSHLLDQATSASTCCPEWSPKSLLDLLSIVVDVTSRLEVMNRPERAPVTVWSLAIALNALCVDACLFPDDIIAATPPALSSQSPSFPVLQQMAGYLQLDQEYLSDMVVITFLQWAFDCFHFRSGSEGPPTVEVRSGVREHLPALSRASPCGSGLFLEFLELHRPTAASFAPSLLPSVLRLAPSSPGTVPPVPGAQRLRLKFGVVQVTAEASEIVSSCHLNNTIRPQVAAVFGNDGMVYLADVYNMNRESPSFDSDLNLALSAAVLSLGTLNANLKKADELTAYSEFAVELTGSHDEIMDQVRDLGVQLQHRISRDSLEKLLTLALESIATSDAFTFVSIDKKMIISRVVTTKKHCNVVRFIPTPNGVMVRCNCEYLSFGFTHTAERVIESSRNPALLERALQLKVTNGPVHALREYMNTLRQPVF